MARLGGPETRIRAYFGDGPRSERYGYGGLHDAGHVVSDSGATVEGGVSRHLLDITLNAFTTICSGLTAYNHNLDTSREFYPSVITTRSYDERLDTIANVRDAGISVCSGGILGLGEAKEDRVGLIYEVSKLVRRSFLIILLNINIKKNN